MTFVRYRPLAVARNGIAAGTYVFQPVVTNPQTDLDSPLTDAGDRAVPTEPQTTPFTEEADLVNSPYAAETLVLDRKYGDGSFSNGDATNAVDSLRAREDDQLSGSTDRDITARRILTCDSARDYYGDGDPLSDPVSDDGKGLYYDMLDLDPYDLGVLEDEPDPGEEGPG